MLQAGRSAPQDPSGGSARLRSIDHFSGSLSTRTYAALREAILALRFRPGEPLRKPDLCAALGVSRSPVSEAIARLAGEGLVDVIPQAGTYVARFSMDDLREGAFLREAIETAAIELVATSITDAELRQLRRSLRVQAACIEDGDFEGFYEQDAQMHATLLSFTRFKRLGQVADVAWVNVNRARQLLLPVPGRVAETLTEHQAIVDALAARDPGAARSAMRHHLRQLMTFLVPLEREHPEFFTSP